MTVHEGYRQVDDKQLASIKAHTEENVEKQVWQPGFSGRDFSILLIDHDHEYANRLRANLTRSDAHMVHTQHAADLRQALDYVAVERFDAILLDHELYAESADLVAALRASAAETPILIIGDSSEAPAEHALGEEANEYIVKGDTEESLLVRFLFDQAARYRVGEALHETEQRFRAAFDHAAIGMGVVSTTGAWLEVNASLCKLLGYSEQELLGMNFQELTHPDDLAADLEQMNKSLIGEIPGYQMEKRYLNKDGAEIYTILSVSLVYDSAGTPLYFISQLMNITPRKKSEAKLAAANRALQNSVEMLAQQNRDMIVLVETQEMLQACLTLDEAFAVFAHYAPDLFPNTSGVLYVINPQRTLFAATASWGQQALSDPMFGLDDCWAVRLGRLHVVESAEDRLVCRHLTRASHPAPVGSLCLPMNSQGEIMGMLYIYPTEDAATNQEQQFARREINRQFARTVADHIALTLSNLRLRDVLRSQAIRDPLTGLFNRRYMEETLVRELHRAVRRKTQLGVILMDVDHFKNFNDRYGHAAGDALLRELSGFLQNHIRGEDIACRYGGEEFIVILPDSSLEATRQRATLIKEGVAKLEAHSGGQPIGPVTLSLGVAAYPRHGATVEALMNSVDKALYAAKEAGRDRVVVASEGDEGRRGTSDVMRNA